MQELPTQKGFDSIMSSVCTHGKDVINPYTNQHMYIPCGKCPACLLKKASMSSIRCEVQRAISRYCYMITLTYDTNTVPRARIITSKDDPDLHKFVVKPRPTLYYDRKKTRKIEGLSHTDDFVYDFRYPSELMRDYRIKGSLSCDGRYPYLNDYVGYLSWKDFQLFMKRFRFKISKLLGRYEKIHTYVTGEYSPIHFRPHFHFLLFFDAEELAPHVGEFVSACWPYGRADWSAARKDASSYVAGYTNSSSRIPDFLNELPQIRAKSRFSNHFGEKFFTVAKRFAHEGQFSTFLNGESITINGRLLDVRPWRSIINSCFLPYAANPRRTGYELCRLVVDVQRAVSDVCTRYGVKDRSSFSSTQAANAIYKLVFKDIDPIDRNEFYRSHPHFSNLLFFARINLDAHPFSQYDVDTILGQLYRLISTVRNFSKEWHISNFDYVTPELRNAVKISQDFYVSRDMYNLKKILQYEEFLDPLFLDVSMHPSKESVKRFSKTSYGTFILNKSRSRLDDSVKHREINDHNIKFVVDYGSYKTKAI